MRRRYLFGFISSLLSLQVEACLSAAQVEIYDQVSYSIKRTSKFQILGSNPYRGKNGYNDFVVNVNDRCHFLDDKLTLDLSLYALGYQPFSKIKSFEQDDNRLRLLFNKLSVAYDLSDTLRITAGKFTNNTGLFYFKSPSRLMNNYYAGYKASRIYYPSMSSNYMESSWGATLDHTTNNYSLSATFAPKLTHQAEAYQSSSNWSNLARSNSRERFLLSYTDNRFQQHNPTVSLLLGNTKSLALADSFSYHPQLVFNGEIAFHKKQQWRHISESNIQELENYRFPNALYQANQNAGMELALGVEYTTDHFSQFGLEYYFQSEGYSRQQWKQQVEAIDFLNQRTGYRPLDNLFDNYKYLIASEIYNVSNKGSYLTKHYLNGYSSILLNDQSKIQPWFILNLSDYSSLFGITFTKPLDTLDKNLTIYMGIVSSMGSRDSEFGLYGQNFSNYFGFNYKF